MNGAKSEDIILFSRENLSHTHWEIVIKNAFVMRCIPNMLSEEIRKKTEEIEARLKEYSEQYQKSQRELAEYQKEKERLRVEVEIDGKDHAKRITKLVRLIEVRLKETKELETLIGALQERLRQEKQKYDKARYEEFLAYFDSVKAKQEGIKQEMRKKQEEYIRHIEQLNALNREVEAHQADFLNINAKLYGDWLNNPVKLPIYYFLGDDCVDVTRSGKVIKRWTGTPV